MNVQYRIRDKDYATGYDKYLTIEYDGDEVQVSVGTGIYSESMQIDHQQIGELIVALTSINGLLNQEEDQ